MAVPPERTRMETPTPASLLRVIPARRNALASQQLAARMIGKLISLLYDMESADALAEETDSDGWPIVIEAANELRHILRDAVGGDDYLRIYSRLVLDGYSAGW